MNTDVVAQVAVEKYGAQQKPEELSMFLTLLDREVKPQVMVEVGSYCGGTAWAWRQLGAQVYAVDDGGSRTIFTPDGMTAWDGVTAILGDSHAPETLERLVAALDGRPVDALFIDGDHSYAGVKADWEMYGPLVREGGLVGFHDIVDTSESFPECEVYKFWAELDANKIEMVRVDRQWGGIGVII